MRKKLLKQRMALSLMLLCGATLFLWAEARLAQMPVPLWIVDDTIKIPSAQPVKTVEEPTAEPIAVMDTQDAPWMPSPPHAPPALLPLSQEAIDNLANFNYLTSRIFLVDPETILLPSDIDVHSFLSADLTIDTAVEGPKVLIFHTHSTEMFVDSDPAYPMTGIMGVGAYLAQVLTTRYGIETLHHTERFDMLDGVSHRPGSYERMEPAIRHILEANPSIQVVIDLHRDGVGPNAPAFIHYIEDTPTAQIMFFNGLSRQNRNGQAVNIDRLPNPYQRENLNFSFRLQLAANQLYPGLARRVYLRAFRYSLHMMPLSTLVEVGNQHNTQQQAKSAMYPLANIVAAVVLGNGK